ncbi:MAG: transketolase [Sedimentisphaerales bacterium]|nr:transketolase [Sedimentisphaerales bacterium]
MSNQFKLQPAQIVEKAKEIRKKIIHTNVRAGQGHTGSDLSEVDILASLFFRILNIQKDRIDDPDRDRFILSKGHGVCGLYCTLVEAGYLPEELLDTYLQFDSDMPGHPVRQKCLFVELNTGALGHGLSVGVGLALSAKKTNRRFRVFVLTGDGELQEGSNWEAAMSGAHFKLDNLVLIVDRNTLQLADRTETIMGLEPLADKFRAFGFEVYRANGHDPGDLIETIESLDMHNAMPKAVIAKTIKGKGVSFIEDRAAWHHRIPNEAEVLTALEELE